MKEKRNTVKFGRPRKYRLVKDAYKRAERNYRMADPKFKPRRKLQDVDGQAGLVCIECGQAKPLTEFWLSNAEKLYFESMCQSCKRRYVRERKQKIGQ